jgi:hypothetical protein
MVMSEPLVTEIRACRICGGGALEAVIDLGSQYIASVFPAGDVPAHLDRPYPLEVVRCATAGGCGLVQLRHSVAPALLYANYGYLSGINEAMRANLRDIAEKVERMARLQPGDLIVDIGCNDGTLLSSYRTPHLQKIGFDPAKNVAQIARTKGLAVENTFFSSEAFRRARPGRMARTVTSIAMFYDLEDPRAFVRDVASILTEDGLWVIELSYLPFMLSNSSYDTICHEHLEYYALRQIEWMLGQEGLQVEDIEFNDINGGSFRLFIRKASFAVAADSRRRVEKVRRDEAALNLNTEYPYTLFEEVASKQRRELVTLLADLRAAGKSVYIYGASTKGNTILQFCGIDHALVPKAVDRNPEKWGRRTLGTNIPIISEEQARAERPDYFLVLPWPFFEVFRTREADFLRSGGKFILPLPGVRVVGIDD